MAVSILPSSGNSLSLQRVITTSGWVDLGDPRLIYFILAGGGGGGGGSVSRTDYGGGGGGGGGGAIAGKLFVGGRVYVHIGAGGTAGAANASTGNTRAGDGGNSYLGVPYNVSNDAAAYGMYWIGATGGMGAANGTTSNIGADAATCNISLNNTGLPSVTGYTSPNTITLGSGAGPGGGGGYNGGNGNGSGSNTNYYPNATTTSYAAALTGWVNNDMRYFTGPSGTSAVGAYNGSMFGIDWTEHRANFQSPGSATYGLPWTLWTTGQLNTQGQAAGGTGGSNWNQPVGTNGRGGMFTGGGGGGAGGANYSGTGGGAMLRGGESSRQLGDATNLGGGGGAGIIRPGANGLASGTGGKGGDGGLGGGGGGGSQCNGTGVTGGVGGQGALALFW